MARVFRYGHAMSPSTEPRADDLDQAIVELLLRVMERMRDHFSARIAEFELTPPLAVALRSLDSPTPQRHLAEVLHCDPSHVTGVVDRLEDRNLVERQVNPDDRRGKNVVLTEAGRALRAELEHRLHHDVPVLERLNDNERRQLRRLLSRLVADTRTS
jgi:DNA-binding MarR family transcriptional regulator